MTCPLILHMILLVGNGHCTLSCRVGALVPSTKESPASTASPFIPTPFADHAVMGPPPVTTPGSAIGVWQEVAHASTRPASTGDSSQPYAPVVTIEEMPDLNPEGVPVVHLLHCPVVLPQAEAGHLEDNLVALSRTALEVRSMS